MRLQSCLRTGFIPFIALSVSALLSSTVALAYPVSAPARHTAARPAPRVAAAATQHMFYISGTTVNDKGATTWMGGLATVMVNADGSYTGTLATVGAKPATLAVSGFVGSTGMTLVTEAGPHAMSVLASPVSEAIGNASAAGPATTAGNEFRGTVMSGTSASGYVTVIDTSILREYSFAASVNSGPDAGTTLNGGLFLMADRYGELHGYFVNDADGTMWPLLSGTLNGGMMLVHVDLEGAYTLGKDAFGGIAQIVGSASATTKAIPNQLAYQGAFAGPAAADHGTWLSSPPEK